jgi:hypothetical protein
VGPHFARAYYIAIKASIRRKTKTSNLKNTEKFQETCEPFAITNRAENHLTVLKAEDYTAE